VFRDDYDLMGREEKTTLSEAMRRKELRKPISRQELERRFKAVRRAMEKEEIDCLIMQNNMGIYPLFHR